jgi:Ca2+-dependent lipid-binding protein
MLSMGIGHLNVLKRLMNVEAENFIKRQLSIKQGCYVNCYILTGRNLASRDIGSESDPYLKLKLGNKKQNTRKEYQDDEPNPDFYKKFFFDASFPGAPALRVAAMDYDELFGDDLIGDTLIDLEDRFYSHHWQSWP